MAAFFTPSEVARIIKRVSIVDVAREHDLCDLQPSGVGYKMLCPFHDEKTPSLHLNESAGLFYCFGCQAGGDVFAFLQRLEKIDYDEALWRLAERAGIEPLHTK